MRSGGSRSVKNVRRACTVVGRIENSLHDRCYDQSS